MGYFGNSEDTNIGDRFRENGNRRQSDPVYLKNEGLCLQNLYLTNYQQLSIN